MLKRKRFFQQEGRGAVLFPIKAIRRKIRHYIVYFGYVILENVVALHCLVWSFLRVVLSSLYCNQVLHGFMQYIFLLHLFVCMLKFWQFQKYCYICALIYI